MMCVGGILEERIEVNVTVSTPHTIQMGQLDRMQSPKQLGKSGS